MSGVSTIPSHCHCCHADHCVPNTQRTTWSCQHLLETVCRVALTVFGMTSHPVSTSIGFVAGLGYGIYIGYQETHQGKTSEKGGGAGCAHGFLEELSGVGFPKALNTMAATGITLEHLVHDHHHSAIPFNIFGALAGLSSGAWSGRSLWYQWNKLTVEN